MTHDGEQVEVSCTHGNEPSSCIQFEENPDYLRNYQLLMKDSYVRSWYDLTILKICDVKSFLLRNTVQSSHQRTNKV